MKALTLKQHRFVLAYLRHGNGARAAREAGYKAKNADVQAQQNLRLPAIRAVVAARLEKAELSSTRTLEELRRVGFFTMGHLFDEEDQLKPMSQLPLEVQAVLSSVKVLKTNVVAGDNKREWLHEVKLWDKMAALQLLAKHFRLIDEHVEVSGSAEMMEKLAALDAGRARNAAAKREREAGDTPKPIKGS